jgi:hypothetical protein
VIDLPTGLVDADRDEPASGIASEPITLHESRIVHPTLSFIDVISSHPDGAALLQP